MNRFIVSIMLLLLPALGLAQSAPADSAAASGPWEKNLRLRLFFNQIYQENWAKGGNNAVNWKTDVDSDITRKSESVTWDNIIRLRYEQTRIADQENRINQNEFAIRSALIVGQRKYINPFFGATLTTQISTGYKYFDDEPRQARSAFWDPVTLTQSFGADLRGIPNTKMRLSFDYSEKIADKYAAFYGIDDPDTDKIEKVETDESMTLWSQYQRKFNSRLSVKAEMEAQYAFGHLSDTVVNYISYIDLKLFSFLNFGIQSEFLYDKQQSEKRQLKNSMGITLLFDLFDKQQDEEDSDSL